MRRGVNVIQLSGDMIGNIFGSLLFDQSRAMTKPPSCIDITPTLALPQLFVNKFTLYNSIKG
jgi:hypothetical protein